LTTGETANVQVTAFSTPSQPHWRWRIVNYAGEMIEESRDLFATIAGAIGAGRTRLGQMDVADDSERPRNWRSNGFRRRPS
jgi:hypothetical protein